VCADPDARSPGPLDVGVTGVPGLEPDVAVRVVEQLVWVVQNSDGVAGLRVDDSVMSWHEVVQLYVPAWPKEVPR